MNRVNTTGTRSAKTNNILFDQFMEVCIAEKLDAAKITEIAKTTCSYLSGNKSIRGDMAGAQLLEMRWYESLAACAPDFSVYDSDWYLGELWACYYVYSRKYLNQISKSFIPTELGRVVRIVDLGCGVGLTSAALKKIFPEAEVIGTNLPGTIQSKIASRLGEKYGFSIMEYAPEGETDIIFASEFFEHIEDPINYLERIIASLNPRALIIANSFNTRAIGHFVSYFVNQQKIDGRHISRLFNKTLRSLGYEKIETGFWNSRPAYWRQNGANKLLI